MWSRCTAAVARPAVTIARCARRTRNGGVWGSTARVSTAVPHRNDAARPVTLTEPDFISYRDTVFNLMEVHGLNKLLGVEGGRYEHLSEEDVTSALQSAIDIAQGHFAPLNVASDREEPTFDAATGGAKTLPGMQEALGELFEAGFGSAHLGMDKGGSQFPAAAVTAFLSAFNGACQSATSYAFLTIAAGHLLATHGSEQQQQQYLAPMLEGRFFATMNLSEPHCGSSLGDIRTLAAPTGDEDGAYLIKGTKMWISGGEHELSESIVHLVLAKTPDAPPGVAGISLFIVPKHHIGSDGSVGAPNDVTLGGLNHKMGWRGTTNCVMNYGENDACRGYLVGELNRGLACMFTMMDFARVGIGAGAAALGYRGYTASLAYALDRTQGRPLSAAGRDPTSPPVPIVRHADVRRMLLVQKAYTEGALSLAYFVSMLMDEAACSEPGSEQQADARLLLDVLTPVVKSWPSEWCLEANKWAIQIHGGYGYTRDFPVEQYYRDNRLNMIHEGTNGIQGLDLLGRKVFLGKGRGLRLLAGRMQHAAAEARSTGTADVGDALTTQADALEACVAAVAEVTTALGGIGAASPERMLANAHEYLNMLGHTVIAWQWLRQATVAAQALEEGATGPDAAFYRGKLAASHHWYSFHVPHVRTLADILLKGDDSLLRIDEEWL